MRTFFFCLIGFVLGALLFSSEDAMFLGGAFLGGVTGLVSALLLTLGRGEQRLRRQLSELLAKEKARDEELAYLRQRLSRIEEAAAPRPAEPAPEEPAAPVAPAPIQVAPIVPRAVEPAAPASAAPPPAPEPLVAEPVAPPEPEPPVVAPAPPPIPEPEPVAAWQKAEPTPLDRALAAFWRWLSGGNAPARIGLVLLFLGLGFALRLAAPYITVELRYAGVALVGIALQAIGWRLREQSRTFALLLQGGGVAVLYLTIFAAMRLDPLLPPELGFPLLVIVVVLAAILAVAQDSLPLAAASTLGGFAAPMLIASTADRHVELFSYFALLNAGILAIAWFKAWRILNIIGFAGTFAIGLAWGIRGYRPALLASTEPFLVLFFLMYVVIAFLFARRVLADAPGEPPADDRDAMLAWAVQQTNYLDGLLLFGTPIAGFGLQYAVIRHIEHGAAYSALGLGVFYVLLAATLLRQTQWRYFALAEVYIALGVIFGTLAIPLALDARWTAAAWAVEGAGVYWIGVRQNRRPARFFALLVQAGAVVSYLGTLAPGGPQSLLSASRLGAALLGGALLFSYWQLRGTPAEGRREYHPPLLGALALLGLGSLYLLAPLSWRSEGTAIAWSLAGVVTIFLGLRLKDVSWLAAALAVTAAGGLAFLAQLSAARGGTDAVLASGWEGFLVSALIGGAALLGYGLAQRDAAAKAAPALGWSLLLLLGLIFLSLAVLFVLPWRSATAIWAASGVLLLVLSLALRQRLGIGFALALQALGGGAFLIAAYPSLRALPRDALTPFAHTGFWTPAIIALAAYVAAWRLFRAKPHDRETLPALAPASNALLVWATLWWGLAWLSEILRWLDPPAARNLALLAAAITVLIWIAAARHWRWAALAALTVLALPAGIVALQLSYYDLYHPAADWGWAAWLALFLAHVLVLRLLATLLPDGAPSLLHVVGCWLFLAVLTLELRYGFIALSDRLNAWRWLGWAIAPAAFLLAVTWGKLAKRWPFAEHGSEYRLFAAAPVALLLLGWTWVGTIASDGDAAPLPYLPLFNPLELGEIIALLSVLLWLRAALPQLPLPGALPGWLIGASMLLLLTCTVLRTAHHWGGLDYRLPELMASMPSSRWR
jgi:uncharacterized membrane protein